jgi:hypothetical protein
MRTALKDQNILPLTQPYSGAPYLYNGTEALTTVPEDVVDWVLIELRDGGISIQFVDVGQDC